MVDGKNEQDQQDQQDEQLSSKQLIQILGKMNRTMNALTEGFEHQRQETEALKSFLNVGEGAAPPAEAVMTAPTAAEQAAHEAAGTLDNPAQADVIDAELDFDFQEEPTPAEVVKDYPTSGDVWVRVIPLNKRMGYVCRTYIVGDPQMRYKATQGWYKVDAGKIDLEQFLNASQPNNPHLPVFWVCSYEEAHQTDLALANIIQPGDAANALDPSRHGGTFHGQQISDFMAGQPRLGQQVAAPGHFAQGSTIHQLGVDPRTLALPGRLQNGGSVVNRGRSMGPTGR